MRVILVWSGIVKLTCVFYNKVFPHHLVYLCFFICLDWGTTAVVRVESLDFPVWGTPTDDWAEFFFALLGALPLSTGRNSTIALSGALPLTTGRKSTIALFEALISTAVTD